MERSRHEAPVWLWAVVSALFVGKGVAALVGDMPWQGVLMLLAGFVLVVNTSALALGFDDEPLWFRKVRPVLLSVAIVALTFALLPLARPVFGDT